MKVNLSPIQQGIHSSKLKLAGTAVAAVMALLPMTAKAQEKQDTVSIATENTIGVRAPQKQLTGWEILGLIGGATAFAWGFAKLLTWGQEAADNHRKAILRDEYNRSDAYKDDYRRWKGMNDDECF